MANQDDVKFKIGAEAGDALRAFNSMEEAQEKVTRKTKAGKKDTDGWGKAFQKLGSDSVVTAGKMVAGWASIGTAIAGAKALLSEFRAEQDKTNEVISSSMDSRKRLAQIANTPEEMKMLAEKSRQLRENTGVGRSKSDEIIFTAASAGEQFLNDDALKRMAEGEVIGLDSKVGVNTSQQFQLVFGGTGTGDSGAGTFAEVQNKLLKAAQISPVGANDIGEVSAQLAVPFSRIGGGDEELLAMTAAAAKFDPASPKAGIEKFKSLTQQIDKKYELIEGAEGLKGMDLITALPELEKKGRLDGGKSIKEFLGEQQAVAGLDMVLKSKELIGSLKKDIQVAEAGTGGLDDVLGRKVGIAMKDPEIAATLKREIEKAKTEEAYVNRFGTSPVITDTVLEAQKRADINNPEMNLMDRALRSFGRGTSKALGLDGYVNKEAIFNEINSGNIGDAGVLDSQTELMVAQEVKRQLETGVIYGNEKQYQKLDEVINELKNINANTGGKSPANVGAAVTVNRNAGVE